MSSNDRPDVPVLNCERSCRTRSKKKYDSFDDDGSEFFLSTPRMFTQKSTLIFVQIEFCVFFFLLFFFCFLLFCSCVVCGTGNGKCDTHTQTISFLRFKSARCPGSEMTMMMADVRFIEIFMLARNHAAVLVFAYKKNLT